MRWGIAALVLCGCSQIFGLEAPTIAHDASTGDTHVDDTPIDTPNGEYCYGVAPFIVCTPSASTLDLTVASSVVIDTGVDAMCDVITTDRVCVIVRRTISINAVVGISGPRPLVLAAGTIDLQSAGYLDARSALMGGSGPGADPPACPTSGLDGMNATGTSSGGAGGSFGTAGGDGGSDAGAVRGGMAAAPGLTPDVLRGGCRGGYGGDGGGGNAAGGDGGGAIGLYAHDSISIAGHIGASGSGGRGGLASSSGGSGGGSGGMIVIAAPMVTTQVSAQIVATGGGGGGGATAGANGTDGQDAMNISQASGGNPGNSNGGAGGTGAGSTGAAQTGGDAASGSNGAGGGGGGGLGVIRVPGNQSLAPAQVYPTPT